MATIAIHAPELSGESGLSLYLRQIDGTLINSGGDSLTESPGGSGRFQAVVAEDLSAVGLLSARVHDAGGPVRGGWLPQGETLVRDAYSVGDADSQSVSELLAELTQGTTPDRKFTADALSLSPAASGGIGPLRGDLTAAEALDLLLAAAIGEAAASGDDETFKFIDGDDAFTTTFDTSNNRISVSLL